MPKEALEFIRRIREEAWEEGYQAGYASLTGKKKKNPYRKKEKN